MILFIYFARIISQSFFNYENGWFFDDYYQNKYLEKLIILHLFSHMKKKKKNNTETFYLFSQMKKKKENELQ